MTSDELISRAWSPLGLDKSRLYVLVGTAWLVLVLGHFLFVNPWGKPLWTDVPASLLGIAFQPGRFLSGLVSVIITAVTHAVYLLVYGLVGWVYVRRRLPETNRSQQVCLAVLLGMILVGLPLHLLGSFHLLGRWQTLVTPPAVAALLFLLPRRATPERRTEPTPQATEPKLDRWIGYTAWALICVISALTFYHALGFPVDYWDALIYYVDYAQRSWEEHGFPTVVCGQVGIGLGANYPHLFHVLEVLGAHIAGEWSDIYGQLLPPVLGLITLGLLAGLLRNLFANSLVTALGVLTFRAIPYGITYQVWVSDYSLVMACTAGFFYCVERFLRERDWRWFEAAALLCAAMPNINYLGWIYFPILCLAPLLLGGKAKSSDRILRRALPMLAVATLLAVPWYIRNIVVTGNPVYAFFHNVLDGKRIDPEVMESCQIEWLSNGDGPAQLGRTLVQRLSATPWYFLAAHPSWKLGPLFNGLLLPGLILAVAGRNRRQIYLLLTGFAFLLFFYEYFVSGLFLYHALGFLPVFSCFAMYFVSAASPVHRRWLALLILVGSLCPGLSFALMGPKFNTPHLSALRYGPMDRHAFYRIQHPEQSVVWRTINSKLEPDAKILTHENRYHLFRRDLELIHLDDWEISRLYDRPFDEIVQWLNKAGVHYYLNIPNEANHHILSRLGHKEHLEDPTYFQEITRSGETVLYRIMPRKK